MNDSSQPVLFFFGAKWERQWVQSPCELWVKVSLGCAPVGMRYVCVCAFICMYVYIHVCEARALCTYYTNALISMPGPCNLRIGVAIESRKITA